MSLWSAVCLVALMSAPGVLCAQQAPPAAGPAEPPKTLPHDLLYGDRETTRYGKLEEGAGELAPVDRREDVDRMAGQGVLLPTAHGASEGALIYTNHLIAGHQVTWGATERWTLSGLLVLPPALVQGSPLKADLFWSVSGTWQAWRGRDVSVALMPFVLGRHGLLEVDTSELGLGAAALVDWAVHDRVVVGAGLMGYAPARLGYEQYDTSGCGSRDDFIKRRCLEIASQVAWGPPGGRFMLGWLHTAIYAPGRITLKAEVVGGVSTGTVWDLEGLVWHEDGEDVQRRRYASRDVGFGPLHASRVTAHLGMGWTPGRWGGQVGLLFVPGRFGSLSLSDSDGSGAILPMMQIGYLFE